MSSQQPFPRDEADRSFTAHLAIGSDPPVGPVNQYGLVALTIVTIHLLDRQAIEEAASQNLHAVFLRIAASVSRLASHGEGGIHNVARLEEAFQDIFELRPSIRDLAVFEISANSERLILTSNPTETTDPLSAQERTEVLAGRSLAHLDEAPNDRAWLITAPIVENGRVVGALRGRFSLWKYDQLIEQEGKRAKVVGVGAVALTCLVFLGLIRIKIQRPIHQLLHAMRRAKTGDLASQADVVGPVDLQELARQFNRMLGRIREEARVQERLLDEIQTLNGSLMARVAEATAELQRTHMRLIEARTQAERTEKLVVLGELSAVVAHALGNPLNAMSGHLQVLLAENTRHEPDQERRLTIIKVQIDRMVEVIQRILDSTRVQVRPAPINLNTIVDEVLALIGPALPSRHITVKTDLAPHLQAVVGDQASLHGMLLNLSTNAIQAMPRGGQLEITTRFVVEAQMSGTVILTGSPTTCNGAVRLTVGDTGEGIPSELTERIFDPFFTRRPHDGGSGLGLAICRRVVSSCGGRLAVESVLGRGTVFTIDLPCIRKEPCGGFANGK